MRKTKRKLDPNKVGFAIAFIVTTAMVIHKIATSGFLFFIVNY
jgi:hypothetical protein